MPCMIANFVPYIDWKIRKLHPQKITFYSGNSYCNKYLFWSSSNEVKSGRNTNELLWSLGMKIDSFGKFKVWIEYWFVHFNENYLIQRSSILNIPKDKRTFSGISRYGIERKERKDLRFKYRVSFKNRSTDRHANFSSMFNFLRLCFSFVNFRFSWILVGNTPMKTNKWGRRS